MKINEPTEQQIADRSERMISEVNDLSDALKKSGQEKTAFWVYTMRRLARLELLVGQLVNSHH